MNVESDLRGCDFSFVGRRHIKGLTDAAELTSILRRGLDSPALTLEYAEIRDAANWTAGDPVGELAEPVALVAAVVGGVRLIDNMEFSAPA